MRKHLVLLISTLILIASTISASADTVNLEQMNRAKCNSVIQSIGASIINSDVQALYSNATYFETSAYESVYKFIERNSIKGGVIDNVIEFTYPDGSSTGDSVIMSNYKISLGNGHNVLYLFEFHINSNGKIYGFNAWEY